MSKSKKRADAFVKQMRSSALYMNPPARDRVRSGKIERAGIALSF